MRARSAPWCLAAWTMLSCSGGTSTHVLVEVRSELGTDLAAVQADVTDVTGATRFNSPQTFSVTRGSAERGEVVVSFGVAPYEHETTGTFLVHIRGLDAAGNSLGENRARGAFVENQRTHLRLWLFAACRAGSCADATTACDPLGACVPLSGTTVDAGMQEPYDAGTQDAEAATRPDTGAEQQTDAGVRPADDAAAHLDTHDGALDAMPTTSDGHDGDAGSLESDAESTRPPSTQVQGSGSACTAYTRSSGDQSCSGYFCGTSLLALYAAHDDSGQCLTDDMVYVCPYGIQETVDECAMMILRTDILKLGEDIRVAISACARDDYGVQLLSAPCLGCYVDEAQCRVEQCFDKCLLALTDCEACVKQAGCEAALFTCMGVPSPL